MLAAMAWGRAQCSSTLRQKTVPKRLPPSAASICSKGRIRSTTTSTPSPGSMSTPTYSSPALPEKRPRMRPGVLGSRAPTSR
jgi:hypothetical protein